MENINENSRPSGIELLRTLCGIFGPCGNEERVRDKIADILKDSGIASEKDRIGNLFVKIPGGGEGYDPENPVKIMISAHMDEVGFMVRDIDADGYIRFICVGGIDPCVLCGKRVVFMGAEGEVKGVIASKAIHHKTAEERTTAVKIENMYVDIGAEDYEDASRWLAVGDYGRFDSEFVRFGINDAFIKAPAIDDRLGCAVIIETLKRLASEGKKLPFDLIAGFTVREEIGKSGAGMAARRFLPDYSVVLESTAVADLPDVKPNSRVAAAGGGGVISLLDRSTIYDADLVSAALELGEKKGIPVQIKKYLSGGNDAGSIHKSAYGTACLAISAPSRYIHSAANVICAEDYFSIRELVYAILTEHSFKK
ncbi:MAG: M20/M25/M40 family metallo-hydrolase [Clostridia bacterium]|nr:M20/M25/M40 family metallo-hydrolase [Clostridia bacterium]